MDFLNWYILISVFFMLCAVSLFSGLYHQQIKENVIKSSEIEEGFTSKDNTSLKFSFWILVSGFSVPLINILLIFLNSAKAKSYFNKAPTIPTSNVDGMMLYWCWMLSEYKQVLLEMKENFSVVTLFLRERELSSLLEKYLKTERSQLVIYITSILVVGEFIILNTRLIYEVCSIYEKASICHSKPLWKSL